DGEMDCKEALAVIVRGDASRLREAQAHLAQCPDCRQGFDQWVRSLLSQGEEAIPCSECLARLPEYAEADANARAQEAYLRAVRAHLETCAACSAVYEDLVGMIAVDEAARGAVLPSEPQAAWNRIASGSYRLSKDLQSLVSQTVDGSWIGGIARVALAPATRRGMTQRVVELRGFPGAAIEARITRIEERGKLSLTIAVCESGTEQPVEGVSLDLYIDETLRESAGIDARHPSAAWSGLPIDHDYALVIRHAELSYWLDIRQPAS
ncbi:MAG: zf-HC2 domain-containing protein, partial [Candidatus Eisenbacteria bacterium]|nr:zf-HC2 domain-containing protein [Candidatus Eisenbacteria bacterium]